MYPLDQLVAQVHPPRGYPHDQEGFSPEFQKEGTAAFFAWRDYEEGSLNVQGHEDVEAHGYVQGLTKWPAGRGRIGPTNVDAEEEEEMDAGEETAEKGGGGGGRGRRDGGDVLACEVKARKGRRHMVQPAPAKTSGCKNVVKSSGGKDMKMKGVHKKSSAVVALEKKPPARKATGYIAFLNELRASGGLDGVHFNEQHDVAKPLWEAKKARSLAPPSAPTMTSTLSMPVPLSVAGGGGQFDMVMMLNQERRDNQTMMLQMQALQKGPE